MEQVTARRLRLYPKKACAGAAPANFLFGGFPHGLYGQLQAQRNPRQRVIAVQDHMLRIDLRDRVEPRAGGIGIAALGQRGAVKRHSLFDLCRKKIAWLQEQQLVVEVTKRIFGLQMQRQRGTGAVALQGFFDAGQKVVAAHQKLYGIVEHIQFFAKGVFQCPGQCDHTLLGNFHRRIVAV